MENQYIRDTERGFTSYLGEYPEEIFVPTEVTQMPHHTAARVYEHGYSIRCSLAGLLNECTPEERASFAEENPDASIDYAPTDPENVLKGMMEAYQRYANNPTPEESRRYQDGITQALDQQVRTHEAIARLVTAEKTEEEKLETLAALYL
jgi:hypothetical protein